MKHVSALPMILVACSCGGDQSEELSTLDSVTGQLARDLDARRNAIRRIESSDLHELVLNEIQALYESQRRRAEARLPDWSWTRDELRSYLALNGMRDAVSFGVPEDQAPEQETPPLEVMKFYAKGLADLGIDLLLIPVPKRLQVYPDRLPGVDELTDFLGADLGYEQALLELAEAGVEVLDLLPTFLAQRYDRSGDTDERLFLNHNPHWTPRGAAIAANAVAARVREYSWFEEGPARPGVDFEVKREQVLYDLLGGAQENPRQQTIWISRVLDKRGRPAAVNDRKSPILWLGDSFTGWYRKESADFLRLLYARLGLRIDNISGDGNGPDALWGMVRRRQNALRRKRLVVWMFSAGTLSSRRLKEIDVFAEDEPR